MICQHPQGVSSAKITIGFPALAANMATRSNAARTVGRTSKGATMITYHGYILMYSLASEKHDQPRSQHRCVVIACVTSGCGREAIRTIQAKAIHATLDDVTARGADQSTPGVCICCMPHAIPEPRVRPPMREGGMGIVVVGHQPLP